MPIGRKEQMAALIVEGQDSLPGPQVQIVGTPGQWFVQVVHEVADMWLGSARRPWEAREFKSLDAAHAAAVEVARLAEPATEAAFHSVRVVMKNSPEAAT